MWTLKLCSFQNNTVMRKIRHKDEPNGAHDGANDGGDAVKWEDAASVVNIEFGSDERLKVVKACFFRLNRKMKTHRQLLEASHRRRTTDNTSQDGRERREIEIGDDARSHAAGQWCARDVLDVEAMLKIWLFEIPIVDVETIFMFVYVGGDSPPCAEAETIGFYTNWVFSTRYKIVAMINAYNYLNITSINYYHSGETKKLAWLKRKVVMVEAQRARNVLRMARCCSLAE